MRADLHVHTYFSDGSLSPQNVVNLAISGGVGLISVTDHDNMCGVEEVKALAKGTSLSVVDGIEVSAYAGEVKFHTLGYGVDKKRFAPFLKKLYEGSFERTEDILKKLSSIGFHLSMDEVKAERHSDEIPVHGMHVARAMIKKGFVSSPFEFFKNYLSSGKPAFSNAGRPTPEEACQAIAYAGGLAVVAHPGRIEMERDKLFSYIKALKDFGLGGIEVYYTTHTKFQTAYYKKTAETLGLFKTGGSDTHVSGGRRIIGQPEFVPSFKLLEKLKIV